MIYESILQMPVRRCIIFYMYIHDVDVRYMHYINLLTARDLWRPPVASMILLLFWNYVHVKIICKQQHKSSTPLMWSTLNMPRSQTWGLTQSRGRPLNSLSIATLNRTSSGGVLDINFVFLFLKVLKDSGNLSHFVYWFDTVVV